MSLYFLISAISRPFVPQNFPSAQKNNLLQFTPSSFSLLGLERGRYSYCTAMVSPKQLLSTIESVLLGPSPLSPAQSIELMHAIRSSLSSLQSLLSYPVLPIFAHNFLFYSTMCNLLTLRLVAKEVLANECIRINLGLRRGFELANLRFFSFLHCITVISSAPDRLCEM